MHVVRNVTYVSDYKLLLSFDDGSIRLVDLAEELDGEIFEPLKDILLQEGSGESRPRYNCLGERSRYVP